jgi:hypothetical protein
MTKRQAFRIALNIAVFGLLLAFWVGVAILLFIVF